MGGVHFIIQADTVSRPRRRAVNCHIVAAAKRRGLTQVLAGMSHIEADPVLEKWGLENGVPWTRQYRDEEVRSAEIVLSGGVQAQLWLEPIAGSTSFAVCAWDRNRNHFREVAELAALSATLTRALAVLRTWTPHANAC